jgi:hypothetical protein
MTGCWLDVLACVAIGLTILAFAFIWYDQRKALKALKKRDNNKVI